MSAFVKKDEAEGLQHIRHRTGTVVESVVEQEQIAPFSLLGIKNSSSICNRLAETYSLAPSEIQDVLPCTPLQEGLLSLTDRDIGDYTIRLAFRLTTHVDIENLCKAWGTVVKLSPILRTRIVADGRQMLQVVLQESITWKRDNDLQSYLNNDRHIFMGLGSPLTRYAIVEDNTKGERLIVWTIHHSLYDGWSLRQILNMIDCAYRGFSLLQPQPFSTYVKYLQNYDKQASRSFWISYLQNASTQPFPDVNNKIRDSKRGFLKNKQTLKLARGHNCTPSTFIRAALGILISRLTYSKDVVFGTTLFGRNCPVDDIENLVGPTITTVPVRINFEGVTTVQSILELIQSQAVAMMLHEQFGLQNIAQLNDHCKSVCQFQTHLTIQPGETEQIDPGSWGELVSSAETFWSPATYALVLQCQLGENSIGISAAFDKAVFTDGEMQRLLNQFFYILEQINSANFSTMVSDISAIPPSDAAQIWKWNKSVPQVVDRLLHEIFEENAQASPEAPAVQMADVMFTYRQLSIASDRLANILLEHHVTPDTIIPICFEKSVWAIVAMLGILKTGSAFLPLDPTQPLLRRERVIDAAQSTVFVASASCAELLRSGNRRVIVADQSLMDADTGPAKRTLKNLSTRSIAYVFFTSGSTGEPKGVMVEHRAICSSLSHRTTSHEYSPYSRVLQFASYTFDASIDDIFMTLSSGGCICIPSEEERMSNLTHAITSMNVNTMCLTPTVARLIDPSAVPNLRTLIFGGEPVSRVDLARWSHLPKLMIDYGPTECSVSCAEHLIDNQNLPDRNLVGRAAGSVCWVVHPDNHNELAPIGAIGELLIEGPGLARGYFMDTVKTAQAFVQDPHWLISGANGMPGRCGRLYKTGDLVRYAEDGTLYFIGRKDTQVKLHGQRIELGDVESNVAEALPDNMFVVAEVVTFSDGRSALVVFIQFQDKDRALTKLEMIDEESRMYMLTEPAKLVKLGHKLNRRLPRHMVPSFFFAFPNLARTASDKIDRKYLRQLASARPFQSMLEKCADSQTKISRPLKEVEARLRDIWAQVLGIDSSYIGIHDDFFNLGGSSVLAMLASTIASRSGLMLPVSVFFHHPVLADQAENICCGVN